MLLVRLENWGCLSCSSPVAHRRRGQTFLPLADTSIHNKTTPTTHFGTAVTFTSGTAAGPFSRVGGKAAVAPAVASPAEAVPEPVCVAASIAPAAPGGAGFAPAESGIRIRWTALPGRSYAVQTSADLVTWSLPISVGQMGQWTDTDLVGVGARFYRVRES